jgi:hypothetical protein
LLRNQLNAVESVESVERLGPWKEEFVSLPDIYQKGPNAIRDKRTAVKVVAILEDHGWLNGKSRVRR